MADSSDSMMELEKWYDKLQKVPEEYHLLCPRLGAHDEENYKDLDAADSKLTVEEKRQRIKDGDERIEITYWNSLIFGFDKKTAGKWVDAFGDRLGACLKTCADCVLNWHMKREEHLVKFAETWNDDTRSHIQQMLEQIDIRRIDHHLTFAKECIENIEAAGATFKRKQLGEHLLPIFVTVYDALCCVPYLSAADRQSTFQFVFFRLQGKKPLKLGGTDALPGMTLFLFDQQSEDRRSWAKENWQSINANSVAEPQFMWAIHDGLINAINELHEKEMSNSPNIILETENFWLGFRHVLITLSDDIMLSHIRNLDARVNIYDMLFRHMQYQAEGILVACIKVLTTFLQKSPKALWDFIGDGRPSVIPEMLFSNPTYPVLLREALQDVTSDSNMVPENQNSPFAISWLEPWLQSLQKGQRFDACDQLLQPLFGNFANNKDLGDVGKLVCLRAGFHAMELTVNSFLDPQVNVGSGTSQLYANSSLTLVLKHRNIILKNLQNKSSDSAEWSKLKVGMAAQELILATVRLDVKMLMNTHKAIHDKQMTDPAISRDSRSLWGLAKEMLDLSSAKVALSADILAAVADLLVVEPIRLRKSETKLDEAAQRFNEMLSQTEQQLSSLCGRFSELDELDLTSLFEDRRAFQGIMALLNRSQDELSESAAEALKKWTAESSRKDALLQVSQLHPDQVLGSMVWCFERVLRSPWPWAPIEPLLVMSRTVLNGLTDPQGVLRTVTLSPKSSANLLRWWNWQWRFVSMACRNIDAWSRYIPNNIMQEFCRDIMELAEALMMEDGLITSSVSGGHEVGKTLARVLQPAKEHFTGMENMIRLKDRWLVEVTVRVLCRILKRLSENELEIRPESRKLIIDACVMGPSGRYTRSTNLTDNERAALLQALGYEDDDVQVVSAPDKRKKQSTIEAWSKSGSSTTSASSTPSQPARSNRDHVKELTPSASSPILKQLKEIQAREAKKPKALVASTASQKTANDRAAFLEQRKKSKAEAEKKRAAAIAREKGGLQGPPRSDIYVQSSDEEDSASDASDADDQLAVISTGGQKHQDEAEKRRRKALLEKTRVPVKKVRQQRSVKDLKARLQPPMDKLHKAILAWDIFHEGADPPGAIKASKVATKYADPASYQQTFFPLLVSEAWRSFVTAKDEMTGSSFSLKVASRASVNDFLEVAYSEPVLKHRERGVADGDILLISESNRPLDNPSSKHCLARVQKHTYKKDNVEITFHVSSRSNPMQTVLSPGSELYAVKITNMTPIEREYAALESVQYYDLMSEVLDAEPSPILNYGTEKIERWMQNWTLNRGQALAILGAQDNDGFTLIQGPPGTGKTKTIIAMVGALLSEQLAALPSTAGTAMRPGGVPNGPQKVPKKLLVCAPSNAAVDELVLRLKQGVTTTSGKTRPVNVVRLGRSEAINEAVKDVTLEELVKKRLEGDTTIEKAKAQREKLHLEAGKIKDDLNVLRPRLEDARGKEDRNLYEALSAEYDKLRSKQRNIGLQIEKEKEDNQQLRDAEVNRRKIQQEILNGAHVLCATLSGSGHDMFRNLDVEFETVIIDEAAQCVELSALIPLKYGCCKCILVGDPNQLPPTVLSQSAARFGYDQSLFVRMQQNHPNSVHMLDMQYRMHPEISAFPSKEFYQGLLKDGQDMALQRRQPWHQSALLAPYRFFDVQGVQEKGSRGRSLVNTKELEVAMQMYDRFRKEYQNLDMAGKIGIITPYKAQLNELRSRFRNRYGDGITGIIEFNTTDAFQGRECEIIIFSCVRASSTGGIGFMKDIRRMNVGLTRAKSSLWILGDSRALVQGEFWKKLIEDAQARDRYTNGDVLAMFRRPLEKARASSSLPPSRAASESSAAAAASDHDVEMTDAGTPREPPRRATPSNEQRSSAPAATRAGGPPVIQSTDGTHEQPKKRSRDSMESDKPATKKVAHDRPAGNGLAGKFGMKVPKVPKAPASRPPQQPKDPSAELTLGLLPPQRPPAIPTSLPSRPPVNGSSSARPPGQAPRVKPPKKKAPALFVPNKRN